MGRGESLSLFTISFIFSMSLKYNGSCLMCIPPLSNLIQGS